MVLSKVQCSIMKIQQSKRKTLVVKVAISGIKRVSPQVNPAFRPIVSQNRMYAENPAE